MTTRFKHFLIALSMLTLLGLAPLPGLIGTAHAIIGRPLTPLSFAGVARRSVRRNAYYGGAAYYGGGYGGGYVPALPGGCVPAGGIYGCGGVNYRPYYDGPNVVYGPVP